MERKRIIITIIAAILAFLLFVSVSYFLFRRLRGNLEDGSDNSDSVEINKDLQEKIDSFIKSSNFYEEDDLKVVMIVGEEFITNKDIEYYNILFPEVDAESNESRLENESKIIQGALVGGLIENLSELDSFYNTPDKDYLKRIEYVSTLSLKIDGMSEKGADFEIVSIWFINTEFIYSGTVEEAKNIAYKNISPIYEKVKNGDLSMRQAGELIGKYDSLAVIDSNYKYNAYQVRENFNFIDYVEYSPILSKTIGDLNEGELSDLKIEIDDVVVNGEELNGQESYYFFVKVNRKNSLGWYDIDDWFSLYAKNFKRSDLN